MEYKAHQAAELLSLSVPALHYYEKAGLLPPIKRNEVGNRLYTDKDIEWLYMLVCMREAGFPIRDIRQYVQLLLAGPQTISQRYTLVQQYQQAVEEKIRAMQNSLTLLNQKSNFYKGILDSNEDIPCSNFSQEWELFKKRQKGGAE